MLLEKHTLNFPISCHMYFYRKEITTPNLAVNSNCSVAQSIYLKLANGLEFSLDMSFLEKKWTSRYLINCCKILKRKSVCFFTSRNLEKSRILSRLDKTLSIYICVYFMVVFTFHDKQCHNLYNMAI